MISATIIADSISGEHCMTGYKLRYPWFIHGEVMTHRALSRNASSNRAIPLAKMLEEVRRDDLRAEPVYWGAEQKSMEPGEPLTQYEIDECRSYWRSAALNAAASAEGMMKFGRAHKSLCNRLLMPFTHANVVISGTEWDNFFGLRLASDVDPTMRALAVAMWEAKEKSVPVALQPGQWHLPFISEEDWENFPDENPWKGPEGFKKIQAQLIKVSVARCARVSYESFETGKRSTIEADLALYERLQAQGHWSPFEHQATPDAYVGGIAQHPQQWGNLNGWQQYRKMMPGEAVKPLPEEYQPFVLKNIGDFNSYGIIVGLLGKRGKANEPHR